MECKQIAMQKIVLLFFRETENIPCLSISFWRSSSISSDSDISMASSPSLLTAETFAPCSSKNLQKILKV